ncbi:MAG: transglycosylase SLT domain-containing protein [Alphaproteobacteria bacterium]
MPNIFLIPRLKFLPSTMAASLFGLSLFIAVHPVNAMESKDICASAIDHAEREREIPSDLLTAIAQTESGRWDADREAVIAWPWTVTNGPDGRFFPTKAKAIAHVRALQARGIRNIDVGCMQINLRHHPDAFADLQQAFDPAANAAYAARFLSGLFESHRSWGEAIRRYHSKNTKFNRPYHQKVARAWNAARQNSAEAHRQAVIAAHLAQRARWRAERAAQLAAAR